MIILIDSIIYTGGQPFARFPSNLSAAHWLRSIGAKKSARLGSRLLFKFPA